LVDPRLSHKCCTVSTYCTILYPLFSIDIKTNMTDPTFSLPFPVAQVAAPPTHTTQVNSGGGWNDPISLHHQQQPAIMNGVSLEQHSATIPSASVASAYAAVATTTSSSNPPTTITTTTTNPAADSTTTMAPTPQPRENWRLVSGGGLETSEQQQQQQQQQPNNNNTTVPFQKPREFFFADDASIRSLVTRVSKDEQAHVLEALGENYTAAFKTVGFCRQRPVQIVSPFAFPPGPERRSFLEAFAEVCQFHVVIFVLLLL